LIASDYYATIDYMAGVQIENFGLFDAKKKEDAKNALDSFISRFPEPKGINILRHEMFLESQQTLLENIDDHIFYLEAPTGSGKTITSINLALQLLLHNHQLNKLFYIFPFNTLVEQTNGVFEDIFDNIIDFQVINSVTPMPPLEQEEQETKYEMSYVSRLFYHSEDG